MSSESERKHRAGERLKQNVKSHWEKQGKQPTDREVVTYVQKIQEKHDRKEK